MNKHLVTAKFVALALAGIQSSIAQAGRTSLSNERPIASPIEQWWSGKYATGNWLGLRDSLEDRGLNLGASWRANFLGVVSGGIQQRAGFDEEFKFFGTLDFAKLTGWEPLTGLTGRAEVRWRDGDGVNKYAGTIGSFNPSTYQGQKQWRFLTAYFTYTTPELFGVKDFLTLSGGWQPPSDFFIVQPESKFFVNNTFLSSRGIATNGILWSGSYSTWGGYMKIKPNDWYYLTTGLWLAAPFWNRNAKSRSLFCRLPSESLAQRHLLCHRNRLYSEDRTFATSRSVFGRLHLLGCREYFFQWPSP